MPTEHQSSSSPGFTLFLWFTKEAVGSVFLQDDCFGSAVSFGTVPASRVASASQALACRPVAEFPFGHNKQESYRERTTDPVVFSFSGILEYEMEYDELLK